MIEFRCPQCGFRVFNRNCSDCEGCGAALPESLLLSPEDVAARQRVDEQRSADRRKEILAGTPGGAALARRMDLILNL